MYNRMLRPAFEKGLDRTTGGNMAPDSWIDRIMGGPYIPPSQPTFQPMPYDPGPGVTPQPTQPEGPAPGPTTQPVQQPPQQGGLYNTLMRRRMTPDNGPYTTNVTNKYSQFFGRKLGANPVKPMSGPFVKPNMPRSF